MSRSTSIRTPRAATTCRRAFRHGPMRTASCSTGSATRRHARRSRRRWWTSDADFESLCLGATPQGVQVAGFTVDSLKKYEGKRLPEIAAAWNKDWSDALIDLTLAERNRLGQVIFICVRLQHRRAGQAAVHEVRDGRRRLRPRQHALRRPPALVRDLSEDSRAVRAGVRVAHAGGRDPQDDAARPQRVSPFAIGASSRKAGTPTS